MLRRSAGGGICEIRGPALHELRERAIGVGGEQPDDLFVERQHLDLYGARREADGDIVATERTVTDRHRILCNETHQQCDDHCTTPEIRPAIASFKSSIPSPVFALVTTTRSSGNPSSSRSARALVLRLPDES